VGRTGVKSSLENVLLQQRSEAGARRLTGIAGSQAGSGNGVCLVACRTCPEHFQVVDKVAVGEVGGMNDIVEPLSGESFGRARRLKTASN